MSRYYKVKKLLEDVYCIRNSFANMILIVGRDKALLFDTGFGFADLKNAIEEITKLPLYVVDSHGHFDHMGGNRYFEGPVYLHEKDMDLMALHSSAPYQEYAYNSIKKFQRILFWLPCLPGKLSGEEYVKSGKYDNYQALKEGETFDLGDITLEVVELPGHTPGSIGLYCRKKRLLLASDAINETVFLFLPESTDLETYIHSLKHAMTYDFDYFINGHVGKLYPKSEINRYLDVAENIDFEHGRIRKNSRQLELLCPGTEVRECFKKGVRPKKGEPFIAICADKL